MISGNRNRRTDGDAHIHAIDGTRYVGRLFVARREPAMGAIQAQRKRPCGNYDYCVGLQDIVAVAGIDTAPCKAVKLKH